jgi:uncharacterized protein YigE (DUF2233 family)
MYKVHVVFLSVLFLLQFASCENIDTATKKKIVKEGKKIAKEISGSIEHTDGVHDFIDIETSPAQHEVRMYLKDDSGRILSSLGRLKTYVESKGETLLYACNAGMYMENQEPLGYYIEKGKQYRAINRKKGYGNFYLVPKGVFYVDKKFRPHVKSIETQKDVNDIEPNNINYLTQSGPLLVHYGKINSLFKKESSNLNIRNAVGILPNGNAYFSMSTFPVNLYDFSKYFLDKGCKEVLSFDGFVCRTYYPQENYEQLDGNFGVMIGVVKKNTIK